MSQVCSKCSRVNPPEAVYCYYDGAMLQGQAAGAPLNPGSAPFPSPFVFPTGQTCQNFDQLAMACQNDWETARKLLKDGFLVGFFGGLGRADLARAAQEAAHFPDADRGLDLLLSKLPSSAVEPPKLRVEPGEVNLGLVPMGTDRDFELQLSNQGGRLVYGSIASDSKWLTLGEAPGSKEKMFQFRDDSAVAVHVVGKHLRTGPKPLVGQLFIESSGIRPITVKVRLEVPVKPFPEGVLAGARSPREVAVKAKQSPKEAANLFENGAVERWFQANGWTYPVQGPAGSGLGAVQQFFEALGLARAPRVALDKRSISFSGAVGQTVQTTLKVETPEKRPVYAHATADEAWLDTSQFRVEAKGRIVQIFIRVASVPPRPGQTLTANIRVAANGNQRFSVPVTLAVQGDADFSAASPQSPAADAAFAPGLPPATAAAPAADDDSPFGSFALGAAPVGQQVPPQTPVGRASLRRKRSLGWLHLAPAVLLALVLLVTVLVDLVNIVFRGAGGEFPLDRRPRISIAYDYPFYGADVNKPLGHSMRFGVRTTPRLDPEGKPSANYKKLTFNEHGLSNSTVLKIDGNVMQYGSKTQGRWKRPPSKIGDYGGKLGISKQSVWAWINEPVEVVQKVERIPGEPFEEKGKYLRALDTCLVRYEIYNRSKKTHNVGLRVMLDTYIGDNDGVPFTIPGVGLVQREKVLGPPANKVPSFIQALEKPDLKNPGTVVQMNLNLGEELEAPTRVVLTAWPGKARLSDLHVWEIPLRDFRGDLKIPGDDDSAVVLYWDPNDLKPGQSRKLGFTYGLGHVSTSAGKLGLTVGGRRTRRSELTVTAYVSDPAIKRVRLKLDPGLRLSGGETATLTVPPLPAGVVGRARPVTWRVVAGQIGDFTIRVEDADNPQFFQATKIRIQARGGIFGAS